jgi:hypothetical protein
MQFKAVAGFTFDEASHTYQLDGKYLTGVTTVLGIRAKGWMQFWRAKAMYTWLLPRLKEVQGVTQTAWDGLLIKAKGAGSIKSKEALVDGKIAHDWIEQYIKSKLGTATVIPMPQSLKAATAVNQFLEWEKAHNVVWHASEVKLCATAGEFAGTVDAIATIDGIPTVLDFKTSDQLSEDVALQTAAYRFLVEVNLENKLEAPKQRAVLRIPKDGNEFDYQRIDTDYDFDIMVFFAMKKVHQWNVYIENNFTVEGKTKLQK